MFVCFPCDKLKAKIKQHNNKLSTNNVNNFVLQVQKPALCLQAQNQNNHAKTTVFFPRYSRGLAK
jgi:hypothetical protein